MCRDELCKLFAPPFRVKRPPSHRPFPPGRGRTQVRCQIGCFLIRPSAGTRKLSLPGERVGVRADNVTNYSPAARGLVLLRDSGLLEHILPELAATIDCEQSPDFHPEGSVFNHICLMLEKMPADVDTSLPWAVLLHDIAKPATAEHDEATGKIHFYGHEKVGADMAENILQRLRFPKHDGRNRRGGAASHAQGCERDAEGDVASIADARDISAGTGIAPAGLPRLLWRFGAFYDFLRGAGRGIKNINCKSVRHC